MFDHIKEPIKAVLPEALVYVRDPRRDGIHIEVLVVDDSFDGMALVAQHRMVLNIFKNSFAKDTLHALGVKTFTPSKWADAQHTFTDLF